MTRCLFIGTLAFAIVGVHVVECNAQTYPAPIMDLKNTYNTSLSVPLYLTNFGAKADAITNIDGVAVVGSTTYTSATAAFTAKDCSTGAGCTGSVDKIINIDFAGPSCGPLDTTIVNFINATTIILGTSASCITGYNYTFTWDVTTSQSGLGSYAVNDILTLQGGTFAAAATATVTSTLVASATIVTPGTLAVVADGSSTGNCYVQGTTGVNDIPFVASLAVTAGIPTAVNSIKTTGIYYTNPTNLASEPVTPVTNCTGLVGTTLSIKMGVKTASPGFLASGRGQYSVQPVTPIATTSINGTGMTATPIWNHAGNYIYGTNDTIAWATAFTKSNTLSSNGNFNCLILPNGISIVKTALPVFTYGPCIHGQSRDKSMLFLAASYVGPAIGVDNTWIVTALNRPEDGSINNNSHVLYGTDLADFGIFGTHYSPNIQEGVLFYDSNDFITINRMFISSLNGSCLGMGRLLNQTRAFTRESNFHDIQIHSCGNSVEPAFFIDTKNVGNSDDLYFTNINIFASFGIGAQISADGNSQTSQNYFDHFRIESMQWQPSRISYDSLVIGSATETGQVDSLIFDKLQIINPYLGYCAVRVTANNSSNAPYQILAEGYISGGSPFGKGLCIDYGRVNEFHFTSMQTDGINIVFAGGAGGANVVRGTACNERGWTYNVVGPKVPVSAPCLMGSSSNGSVSSILSFSSNPDTGTIAEGNRIGSGSINLSPFRATPYQVPAGSFSFSAAAQNSRSSGNNSVDISSYKAVLAGNFTRAIAAYSPNDHTWPTSDILSGFSTSGVSGGNQIQQTALGCATTATNAATCILTSDGSGIPTLHNIANLGINIAQATNLVCSAHDRTANTNSLAWVNIPTLFQRQTTAASVIGAFGSIPAPLSIGTTTGATLTVAANTTNGGAALTFTAPTVNAAIWDVTCYAPTVQTN